jgi:hypothetical protein
MTFGKSILLPSDARQPAYKSNESLEKNCTFACLGCDEQIMVEFKLLIEQHFGIWEEKLGKEFAEEAKKFYGIGFVGKSRDGGWPSMVKVQCNRCNASYLVYAGVKEIYNSIYFVTLQGITECK